MTNQNKVPSPVTVSIQSELRPALTPVLRNRDYDRMAEDLKKLDTDLRQSGIEFLAMRLACEDALAWVLLFRV